MTHKKNILVLIDGNAIIHRAYHALPPMTTKDGRVVHAAYGFVTMLLRVIDELQPTHIAVAFDVAGGTFRDELYAEYKAHRVKADQELYDQIPIIHDIVRAFGIQVLTKEGYEADDILGTVAKHAQVDTDVIIVTGDKDLLQLVNDHIKVYLLRKGFSDLRLCDASAVKDLLGFSPEFVCTFKALAGDSSDNIPGVAGVGEKSAKELIEKVGTVEKVYASLDSLEEKGIKPAVVKKLRADEAGARMSLQLATIHTQVPGMLLALENVQMRPWDLEKITPMFQSLEFTSLLRRLNGFATEKVKKRQETEGVKIISCIAEVDVYTIIGKQQRIYVQPVMTEQEEKILFATDNVSVYSADMVVYMSALKQCKQQMVLVCHDSKALIKSLHGLTECVQVSLFDFMLASYVENSSTRSHDKESIIARVLGRTQFGATDTLFGAGMERMAEILLCYPALYEYFDAHLHEDEKKVLEDIEQPLVPVLAIMEEYGVKIDMEILAALSKKVAIAIAQVSERIWASAGKQFNISSSLQLRDVLFETLQLSAEGIKKGKTGYSTAQSELDKLKGLHPIIADIEEYRELEKLRNTYIDVLPNLADAKTHRIHTTYNQTVTATGRLSSSEPNLQNIPIRTELGKEIRNAFVAEDGYVLLCADYSQIELRIAASLANDSTMIDVFARGEDIHTATAAVIHGVPIAEVTKDMRRSAKEINFGVLYGMGAYGLSARTNLSTWEAQKFIDTYFERFSGVKKYIDATIAFAREHGYVETLFGRKRYISELMADNKQLRTAGERMAVNMPVQGTAADMMKLAMIAVAKKIDTLCSVQDNSKKHSIKHGTPDVRMILQVHDELVFEVKEGKEKELAKIVKETMEQVVKLKVPVVVEVGMGKRWGEAK